VHNVARELSPREAATLCPLAVKNVAVEAANETSATLYPPASLPAIHAARAAAGGEGAS
jgi:hypothetical protein